MAKKCPYCGEEHERDTSDDHFVSEDLSEAVSAIMNDISKGKFVNHKGWTVLVAAFPTGEEPDPTIPCYVICNAGPFTPLFVKMIVLPTTMGHGGPINADPKPS